MDRLSRIEVLVPDFTFAATVNAVLYSGATPILVDIDPLTWNINLDTVLEKITKSTKAIIPVHIYGQPCEMDEIAQFAADNDLLIVEDCAEALGSKFRDKAVAIWFQMVELAWKSKHYEYEKDTSGVAMTEFELLGDTLKWKHDKNNKRECRRALWTTHGAVVPDTGKVSSRICSVFGRFLTSTGRKPARIDSMWRLAQIMVHLHYPDLGFAPNLEPTLRHLAPTLVFLEH